MVFDTDTQILETRIDWRPESYKENSIFDYSMKFDSHYKMTEFRDITYKDKNENKISSEDFDSES